MAIFDLGRLTEKYGDCVRDLPLNNLFSELDPRLLTIKDKVRSWGEVIDHSCLLTTISSEEL